MTVGELLERISSRELTEWMAYAQVAPFGENIPYIGHAITASTIANVNRGKHKPYDYTDFMPTFEKKEQTVEEMIQFAAMMTVGLGGKDMREDNSDG